ncbi:MAG: hypothetical protein WBA42_01560 [Mesorhizobium sp.]
MNTQEHSTASAGFPDVPANKSLSPETGIKIGRARDAIERAYSLVELINMASEAGSVTGDAGNAIAWGCVHIRELLERAGENLMDLSKQKGGAGSSIDPALAEMLTAHAETTAAINRSEGDPDATETVALLKRQYENAMAIISYRPLTKADEYSKAEFLREWAKGSLFSEREQNALIASMLPEGGAA